MPARSTQVMEAVNAAFQRMPKEEVQALLARKQALSLKHGMNMFTDRGKPRVIDVQLRPWAVTARQWKFFHRHSMILRSALGRLLPLYLDNPDVRNIIPLDPEEEEWLLDANRPRLQHPRSVVDRLDSTATFTPTDWAKNFWYLEPNSVGIGGVHYIPATCLLTKDWLLPTLKKRLPKIEWVYPDDIRFLMTQLFVRHAKALGRKLRRVGLIEDQSVQGGTDEFNSLARYLKRQGIQAVVCDPRQIQVKRNEFSVQGKRIDLFYRDTDLIDLIEMGKKAAGIKEAFNRNQVVSSLAGELDHKSAWELFTNPDFSRFFTLTQKRLFRKHVLWTRLIFPRKTTDPKGKKVDLTTYIRRHREELTIKPNRAFGGEGVVFGHAVSKSDWEKEIARSLKKPSTYVVQRAAEVRAELFPVAKPSGVVKLEPYYAVTGFAATPDGVAILGRSSKEAVVKVSRRGGLIAIWKLG